ncbi:prepilin peptidase [Pectinatus sottacetonis]|uniref:prepilin peptidase n=1 Tax=Pectinatus sottacetonis TaxID=1002795 RepID=UPI0018C534D9
MKKLFIKSFLVLIPLLYINICGISLHTLSMTFLFSTLFIISYIDCQTYIIPNYLLAPLFISGLLYQKYICTTISVVDTGLALLFISIVFLPVYLLSSSIGGGDIKLSYTIAVWLSYPDIIGAVLITVSTAILFSLYLIIYLKKNTSTLIPFAPFLSLGAFAAVLFHDHIANILEKWTLL